ncbi:MAG: hypothetical protein KAH07_03050 [Flavobacteriaceae bacterium]|nr:hypothetical protein [Flavobacteriaceae bacterium]
MKIIVLLCVLAFVSCKPNHEHDGHQHVNEESHKHQGGEFITKTGKTIIVKEIHSDSASLVSVEITAKEFENGNHFILEDIDPIVSIELQDLDQNGFEELYIITQSAGSGSYLNVIGYASNSDKSLSSIYFPELTNTDFEKGNLFEGYMGHDQFYFKDQMLVREFPIYGEGDSNSNPTGQEKKITYLLVSGEASWLLKVQETYTAEVKIVRNCTGTYVRFEEHDYKVCNNEMLASFKNNEKASLTFKDSYPCKLPKETAICAMYHPFMSTVSIIKTN